MHLSIVIVTYNSGKTIEECLESIYKTIDNIDFEIIITDNNSVDKTIEIIKNNYKQVILIERKDNLGFAFGVNCGLKKSNGKYLLLLNPDVVLEKDTVNKSLEFYQKQRNIGALACKLLNNDRSIQNNFGNFPSFFSEFIYATFLFKFLPFGHLIQNKNRYKKPKHVDWVSGAFMLFSREAMKKAGLFDESYFMYVEDIDFCYRLNELGMYNYYYPLVCASHELMASSIKGKTKNSWKVIFWEAKNTLKFAKKHLSKCHYSFFMLLYKLKMSLQMWRWALKGEKYEVLEFKKAYEELKKLKYKYL